jgi:hypothetical protein
MKLLKQLFSYGWVEACANGRVRERDRERERERERGREREREIGTEMVSSIVMYNFGGGPRGDPMNLAF